jgi:hypothetical protein
MATANPLQATAGLTVLYPTLDTNVDGHVNLTLVDKFIALLIEQRVMNNILLANGGALPDINQMRADELASIIPPGSL